MDNAVRLTLRDGTRTSVPGNRIVDVEPDGRGALVHLLSGETLCATQDARMLEIRWRTALADRAPTLTPAALPITNLPSEPEMSANIPAVVAPVRVRRMARLLHGRISRGAFVIAGFSWNPATVD